MEKFVLCLMHVLILPRFFECHAKNILLSSFQLIRFFKKIFLFVISVTILIECFQRLFLFCFIILNNFIVTNYSYDWRTSIHINGGVSSDLYPLREPKLQKQYPKFCPKHLRRCTIGTLRIFGLHWLLVFRGFYYKYQGQIFIRFLDLQRSFPREFNFFKICLALAICRGIFMRFSLSYF